MADWKLKGIRGPQRRRFLKMMGVAAAGVGLERTRLLNYLADVGGSNLAEAAVNRSNRAVVVSCGNGSYAWFQELWPHVDVARKTVADNRTDMAYLYGAGQGYAGPPGVDYTGGDKPMYYSPDAPWMNAGVPTRPVTAIMAGNDETHTSMPDSANTVGASTSLTAAIGSIQAVASTAIVPVIGVDPLDYGTATGAPDVTTVPDANGMVELFNSAASQFTLSDPTDQQLFESYYNALVGLRRASPRSSWQPQLQIAKNAARLIGLNFAAELTPVQADLDAYGITALNLLANTELSASQKAGLEAFARTLIVTARAFKLGLTNSAILALSPGPTSETLFTDPHVTYTDATNMNRGRNTTLHLGMMLDAFYNDLATAQDPELDGETLDQSTVFVAFGDTPHTPVRAANWPDATPQAANWLYVMGQGYIADGWFGRIDSPNVGGGNNGATVYGFDPVTGADVQDKPSAETSAAAGAAVAYAITRGDWNTVTEYYSGPKIDAMLKV